MKKNLLIAILSISMLFANLPINVLAKNNGNKSQNQIPNISQLDDYVIDGSGTREDPYIIDDACPYKEIMDNNVNQIFNSLNGEIISSKFVAYSSIKAISMKTTRTKNYQLVYMADFGGALSKKIGNYAKGGYWLCTGNYPSVVSDNVCWIQKIAYVSNASVKKLAAAKNNGTLWNIIKTNVYDKGKYGAALETAIIADAKKIGWAASKKIAGCTISEIAKAASFLFWFYYGTQVIASLLNYYTYSTLNSWGNAGYGALNIIYSISYQGSWYSTYTETKWTTYPTVYGPAEYYGTGYFSPYA